VFPVFPFQKILSVYFLNDNRQWTEDAKGGLNVPAQNFTFSHFSEIKHGIIQDCYVIKT